MIKYMRSYILLLYCFFSGMCCFGQKQPDMLEMISTKFNRYCELFPREEIYIHSDRQEYISGEDLWFGVYLIDRQSLKPSDESRIGYIEILNGENRPIIQKRIRLENGYGSGQITLPDTISSGIYLLRGYTNWMKNFMPFNCFTKKLIIYNSLTDTKIKFLGYSLKSLKSAEENPGQKPSISGLKVETDNSDPQLLKLNFNADEDFLLREGTNFYMFVHTHGVINHKRTMTLLKGNTLVTVPKNLLIPGINHFTVFNITGKPVMEIFSYTPVNRQNNLTPISKEEASIREKIPLDIVTDVAKAFKNLSVSIALKGSNNFPGITDYLIFGSEFGIVPDEILNSGSDNFSGEVFNNYLSTLKSNWIDWNIILKDKYPVVKYQKEKESHFIYGQLIDKSSRLPDVDKFLFLSIPGKNAFFRYSKTDKNGDFIFTVPLENKMQDLIIQTEEISGNNTIKLESSFSTNYVQHQSSSGKGIVDIPGYISKMGINYQIMKIYRSEELSLSLKSQIPVGASKRFYGKPDIELLMDNYIKLPVMQEVFFELIPGVLLRKRKAEFEIAILDPVENRIYDKPPVLFVDGVVINDPSIVANLDPEKVEKIDAIKTRYFVGNYLFFGLVNVITRTGDFSSVTLPDYAVRFLYTSSDPVKPFSSPEYSSPEMKQNRLPDFRNTLYWNSSVMPDKEGNMKVEFWTSDFKSENEIIINGITNDGQLVSARKTINVK